MHNLDLIVTLTGGLAAALALGYVTHTLRLSPIVGYLLAGVVVGPNTPGFVANRELAAQLAEVGIILLMFGVGLHFDPGELMAVRRIAVPGAIGQCLLATALGLGVGRAFGWGWAAGVVFGLAVSVASTVVLTRVLSDNDALHTPAGHAAVGWLIVQDLIAVVVLVLLPALAGREAVAPARLPLALGLTALKILAAVAGVIIVGERVIPWLLRRVAATRSRELFTLTILVVALGIAVGSAKLFGVSMALGAFLAGMVVGRSDFSVRAATEALPMRDAFAVLFFVSVGMLFDPGILLRAPGLVAATLAVIVLGSPAAALAIVLARGHPLRVALVLALALTQIGEFSFIIAGLGRELGVLTEDAAHAVVAAAIASISLNPLLVRLADPLEAWVARRPALLRRLTARARRASDTLAGGAMENTSTDPRRRAVIVGYGPVGRTLVRLLRENGIEPTVVELNLDSVQRLREDGVRAVYGDATHPETLKEAGAKDASVFILSSAGMRGSQEAIRLVREVNPRVRVFARSNYVREIPILRRHGADAVFAGEGEVALAMNEAILRGLGASGEQIDRERDRIRDELFGDLLTIEILLPPPSRPPATGEQGAALKAEPEHQAAPFAGTARRLTDEPAAPPAVEAGRGDAADADGALPQSAGADEPPDRTRAESENGDDRGRTRRE